MNEIVSFLTDPNRLWTAILAVIIAAELLYLFQATARAKNATGGLNVRHILRALVPTKTGSKIYTGFVVFATLIDTYRLATGRALSLNQILFLVLMLLSLGIMAVDRYEEQYGSAVGSRLPAGKE
jgi:hypothetical protein